MGTLETISKLMGPRRKVHRVLQKTTHSLKNKHSNNGNRFSVKYTVIQSHGKSISKQYKSGYYVYSPKVYCILLLFNNE